MSGFIPPSMASVPGWQQIVADSVNPLLRGVVEMVAKTTAYTLTDQDYFVACDATGAAFTITLPAAALYAGKMFTIKKTDASANAVTIDGNGAETIDGALTASLATQYRSKTLLSNGTTWHIIADF